MSRFLVAPIGYAAYTGRTTTQRSETEMGDTAERAKEALERDWEQTKHDLPGMEGKDLDQDASDTVKQATGKEPIPPDDVKSD